MTSAQANGGPLTGEVVIRCQDLQAEVDFFVGIGFRVERVLPADDPRRMVLSGHGLRVSVERHAATGPVNLRLPRAGRPDAAQRSPGGSLVEWESTVSAAARPAAVPEVAIVASSSAAEFHVGRAGMQYRDLLPGRFGGRYIVSHIRIPDAGPVPDQVHFHRVGVQLILCLRGWVRVVYEDQGEPFALQAGDAVLQPPEIRHRVLECSEGLEVLELSSPAEHDTRMDHDLALPNRRGDPARAWAGQQFLHTRAKSFGAWHSAGFSARPLGLAAPSAGQLEAFEVRADPTAQLCEDGPAELKVLFVTDGHADLQLDGALHSLGPGGCAAFPGNRPHTVCAPSPDLRLWEIRAQTS